MVNPYVVVEVPLALVPFRLQFQLPIDKGGGAKHPRPIGRTLVPAGHGPMTPTLTFPASGCGLLLFPSVRSMVQLPAVLPPTTSSKAATPVCDAGCHGPEVTYVELQLKLPILYDFAVSLGS